MINAHELMLFNLVQHQGKEMEVFGLYPLFNDPSSAVWNINGIPADDIDPIPITPERLLDFGFKFNEEHSDENATTYWLDWWPVVIWHKNRAVGGLTYQQGDVIVGSGNEPPKVQYVHELQNQYYWQVRKLLKKIV